MAKKKAQRQTVYIGAPHVEDELVRELERRGAQGVHAIAPGIVATSRPSARPPIFARQVLDNARLIEGDNVDALLGALYGAFSPEEESHWLTLTPPPHVFAPDKARAPRGQKSKDPLAGALETLQQRQEQKRTGRRKKRELDDVESTGRGQLLLVADTKAYVSIREDIGDNEPLSAWPSPFVAGRAPVPVDKKAPSTAYKKVVEALAWLGVSPGRGDTVLDLGGAPGGWSHIAIKAGAEVIGVDRGEFAAELKSHPSFTHLKKDAFVHAPLDACTFLFCDIIGDPKDVFALANDALSRPKVRAGVVTLKLTRPADLDFLESVQRELSGRYDVLSRVQHLRFNKQEVTLLWRR